MEQKKASNDDQAKPARLNILRGSSASVVSRVGASASNLVHEALLRPDLGYIAHELGFAAASSTKGSASSTSAGPSVWSMSLQNPATLRFSSRDKAIAADQYGFRKEIYPSNHSAVEHHFQSFLSLQDEGPSDADYDECWSASIPPALQHADSGAALSGQCTATRSVLASPSSNGGRGGRWPDENSTDGAAVIALLSDPSFSVDDIQGSPTAFEDPGYGSQMEEDPQNIVPRASSGFASPINSLSLIPNFGKDSKPPRVEDSGDYLIPWLDGGSGSKAQSWMSKSGESFEVQPWLDMLTTYHDKVWGDPTPLVQDAVKEASAIRNGDNNRRQDCPAIRRLAMVVAHISHAVSE
ncbi:MAG: hypothetical protein Q9201_004301 [Fulgogasparrea decipioides]